MFTNRRAPKSIKVRHGVRAAREALVAEIEEAAYAALQKEQKYYMDPVPADIISAYRSVGSRTRRWVFNVAIMAWCWGNGETEEQRRRMDHVTKLWPSWVMTRGPVRLPGRPTTTWEAERHRARALALALGEAFPVRFEESERRAGNRVTIRFSGACTVCNDGSISKNALRLRPMSALRAELRQLAVDCLHVSPVRMTEEVEAIAEMVKLAAPDTVAQPLV